MTAPRCGFCLEAGHVKTDCPQAGSFFTTAPLADDLPSTRDDAYGALSDRYIATRVYAGQLRRLLRENGIELDLHTRLLNPDADSED